MSSAEKDEDQQPGGSTFVGISIENGADKEAEHPDISALKALFKTTLETRNFEISMLVQRNNFFMVFQGVLFAGLIQSSHQKPIVSFMVCLAGFLVSFFQVKMAAGAKFWQEYWEEALHRIERELLQSMESENSGRNAKFELFHDQVHIYEQMVRDRIKYSADNLTNKLIMSRYSVSRVPIHVAITLGVIWLLLCLCTLRAYPPLAVPSFVVGF